MILFRAFFRFVPNILVWCDWIEKFAPTFHAFFPFSASFCFDVNIRIFVPFAFGTRTHTHKKKELFRLVGLQRIWTWKSIFESCVLQRKWLLGFFVYAHCLCIGPKRIHLHLQKRKVWNMKYESQRMKTATFLVRTNGHLFNDHFSIHY